MFVLTLGFSRRHFMEPTLDEQVPQLLDAHERAFDHFGGHTREHLYDRPRTICRPDGEGGVVWNPTFQSFARYWGFEARLCRPYRAQTKGKVESGVKYLKRNFLVGRSFVDLADVRSSGRSGTRPSPTCVCTARRTRRRWIGSPKSEASAAASRTAGLQARGALPADRRRGLPRQPRHQPLLGAVHVDRPRRRGRAPRRPGADPSPRQARGRARRAARPPRAAGAARARPGAGGAQRSVAAGHGLDIDRSRPRTTRSPSSSAISLPTTPCVAARGER